MANESAPQGEGLYVGACNNALATKANLFRRKITEDSFCPLCKIEAETTGHALWGCPIAKSIRGTCGKKIQKRFIVQDDFVLIVEDHHGLLDSKDMELLAITARLLWFR